jgi:small subunit ribosomal protein S17
MSVKQKIGTVVSNKMDKTIVIVIENRYSHPLYSKILKKTKRFMAHDEKNECKIGDRVIVQETRPLSAKKRWELKTII